MALISNFIGSVHGQRITSIAKLHELGKGGDGLVPRDALVQIVYKFNDNLYYPWAVESFSILPNVPPPQVPNPFLLEQTADDYSCFGDEKDEDAIDVLKWPHLQLSPGSPTTIMLEDVPLADMMMDDHHHHDIFTGQHLGDDIFHHQEICQDDFYYI